MVILRGVHAVSEEVAGGRGRAAARPVGGRRASAFVFVSFRMPFPRAKIHRSVNQRNTNSFDQAQPPMQPINNKVNLLVTQPSARVASQ